MAERGGDSLWGKMSNVPQLQILRLVLVFFHLDLFFSLFYVTSKMMRKRRNTQSADVTRGWWETLWQRFNAVYLHQTDINKPGTLTSGPASSRRRPPGGSWAQTGCSLLILRSTH